jgi:hypothetical protein
LLLPYVHVSAIGQILPFQKKLKCNQRWLREPTGNPRKGLSTKNQNKREGKISKIITTKTSVYISSWGVSISDRIVRRSLCQSIIESHPVAIWSSDVQVSSSRRVDGAFSHRIWTGI